MKGLRFGKMAGHMKLQMLQAESLYATQQVAAELFPWEHEHQLALSAVLDPVAHADFYRERRLASVRCWTVQADRAPAEDVGGLAMLYGYRAQPDELWLAWFGLMPRLRGLGAGRELLDWVVDMARREGRRTLRLWTTDEAEYAAALRLYARCGFRTELPRRRQQLTALQTKRQEAPTYCSRTVPSQPEIEIMQNRYK